MNELTAILETLKRMPGIPGALSTLVAVEGSSYRRPGARALLVGERRIGSISGGCLEEDLFERMLRVLESGVPELVRYDTTNENDAVWGVGVGCRGVVEVLVEPIPAIRPSWTLQLAASLNQDRPAALSVVYAQAPAGKLGTFLTGDGKKHPTDAKIFSQLVDPPLALIVFGAGDDAMPLVRMAKELGWKVTVADSRAAYATRSRFPVADAVIVTPAGSVDEHIEIDQRSFLVIMTHRYSEDLKLLGILLARPFNYMGLLGPRNRAERLLSQLRLDGALFPAESLLKLCAPVGLDLGGSTPESIALAILAEIQCWQTGRVPAPLRDRVTAIHG